MSPQTETKTSAGFKAGDVIGSENIICNFTK
jgi:hypothetical protein